MGLPNTGQAAVADWPLYWFAQLEGSLERGDLETALQAQRRLERLGITVHYRLRHPAQKEVALCAE